MFGLSDLARDLVCWFQRLVKNTVVQYYSTTVLQYYSTGPFTRDPGPHYTDTPVRQLQVTLPAVVPTYIGVL